MAMDSLHDALMARMKRFGLEKAMTATLILETVNRILPEGFSAKTYREGSVTVLAPSAADAYFFKQDCDGYIERMNAALDKPIIEKIYVRTQR